VSSPATDGGTDAPWTPADSGTDGGWAPATVCALAFDPGPCRGAIPVYAFVGGSCVQKLYGGCEGNANRFSTLDQCYAACVAPADPGGCPPNRIYRTICLACGPAGGCASSASVCALVCDVNASASPCDPVLQACFDDVCQAGPCI
jgi:hypothetical protein